jgi:hypothetical protein
MNRSSLSAISHGDVAFANPLPETAIDDAIAALRLPARRRAGALGGRGRARHDGLRAADPAAQLGGLELQKLLIERGPEGGVLTSWE